jgi:hypothetical protein
MHIDEILSLFEREKRIGTQMPGMRREVLPNLVRHVDLLGYRGMISWSDLTPATVEREIREQVEFYSGLKQAFEWKVFRDDHPPELKVQLKALGSPANPKNR